MSRSDTAAHASDIRPSLAAPSSPRQAADPERQPQENVVLTGDAEAEGVPVRVLCGSEVYGLPSCPAHASTPDNLRCFASWQDAAQAGFRPCKRCQPDQVPLAQRHAQLVAEWCRWMDQEETPPGLAQLAERASMSAFHVQRVFKAVTGISPKAYLQAQRAQRLREQLAGQPRVSDAMFDVGYGSSSRFYASARQALGMAPATYRRGGPATRIRFALGSCRLGEVLVAATEQGLCAISLGSDVEALLQALQDRFPRADLIGGAADFEQWVAQVVGFIDQPDLGLALPLDVRGTLFQQRVWLALRDIPPGSTISYRDLAARIGASGAARAVAAACAANPLAVAIPCHRVVRSDGQLAGYRWGLERKRALLQQEAEAVAARPHAPTPHTGLP